MMKKRIENECDAHLIKNLPGAFFFVEHSFITSDQLELEILKNKNNINKTKLKLGNSRINCTEYIQNRTF